MAYIISPCHDGHFDIMGKNISGPPPRPLDEFNTRIENGNLLVTLPSFKRNVYVGSEAKQTISPITGSA